MGWSFVIGFREGIEAVLIVSIALAFLRQLGASRAMRLVWWAAALAVCVSVLVGGAVFSVGSTFDGWASDVYEGVGALGAVGFLTWLIVWVRRRRAKGIPELEENDLALASTGLALAGLAFFAVLREGAETVLFLFAAAHDTASEVIAPPAKLVGAGLGLTLAGTVGAMLYVIAVRMNPRWFFRVSGWILIVMGAGLFAYALHEFQEAGLIPILEAHAFDITGSLPDEEGVGAILRGLVGYHADASRLEVIGWLAYLVVAAVFYVRNSALAPSDRGGDETSVAGSRPPGR
jgi:high-affinity iron transporter